MTARTPPEPDAPAGNAPEGAPEDTPAEPGSDAGEPRRGLPDWLWAGALTAAIAALLIGVGAGTFAA